MAGRSLDSSERMSRAHSGQLSQDVPRVRRPRALEPKAGSIGQLDIPARQCRPTQSAISRLAYKSHDFNECLHSPSAPHQIDAVSQVDCRQGDIKQESCTGLEV
jgi:hypothetical protein